MGKPILRSRLISVLAACSIGASGAYAQSQSGSSIGAGAKPELKVGHVDHTRAMENLLGAAQKFREAIQQLAQQEPGPKRDAALDASREALHLTQRAMLQLPPDMRVKNVEVRDAKEWPKAMARLDRATQRLNDALNAMSKPPAGKDRASAIATVSKALAEAQEAMLVMPEYRAAK